MLIAIKGAGDLATGIACRLHRCGFQIVCTDIEKPTTVRCTETRNAAKDAAGTVSESMGNSVSFARSAGQQVVMDLTRGVMQGGTRLIAGRVRAVKVTLKAGYKVLLVTKRQ